MAESASTKIKIEIEIKHTKKTHLKKRYRNKSWTD
jgi:hypothetical protein